jgi:5-methylcytosine-specific restriction endonuclease McrA
MAHAIISRAEAIAQGRKRYATGKPCKKGHIAERWVSATTCCECQKLWIAANQDKVIARANAWRKANPDKRKAIVRKYDDAHREEKREKSRARYAANPMNPERGMYYDKVSRKAAKAQGLLRYTTGKPCINGHIAERLVSNGSCCQCVVETQRATHDQRYQSAKARGYFKTEKYLEKVAAYREANREKTLPIARNRAKRNYEENPEKFRARSRTWREANLEKAKALNNAWKKAHPEKTRAQNHKRRARLLGAEGHHTVDDIAKILKMQKGKCALCRVSIKKEYQIDHIVALTKGGSNWPRNLQLLCKPCNSKKNNNDPIEYAQRLGFLL